MSPFPPLTTKVGEQSKEGVQGRVDTAYSRCYVGRRGHFCPTTQEAECPQANVRAIPVQVGLRTRIASLSESCVGSQRGAHRCVKAYNTSICIVLVAYFAPHTNPSFIP